jgi:hypothetical protein
VHPRLGDNAELVLAGPVLVVDVLEGADRVAADHELRVDDEVDGAAEGAERGGDRVDEERHVVGDDLDDGVSAGPPLVLDIRVRHRDVDGADGPPPGEVAFGERGAEEVLRLTGEEILGRGVPVEHSQQPVDVLAGVVTGVLSGRPQLLGPGLLERRRHGRFRVPSLFRHRARVLGCRFERIAPVHMLDAQAARPEPVENTAAVCVGPPTVER